MSRYVVAVTVRDEEIRPLGGLDLVEFAGVWWARWHETEEDGTRGEHLLRLDHISRLAALADTEEVQQ